MNTCESSMRAAVSYQNVFFNSSALSVFACMYVHELVLLQIVLDTISVASCGVSVVVSVCVCEVRGLAPLLFSVKVFSNHVDCRGSCLLCVGVCPCEQPVGLYREIAGADACHVLVYERVSE